MENTYTQNTLFLCLFVLLHKMHKSIYKYIYKGEVCRSYFNTCIDDIDERLLCHTARTICRMGRYPWLKGCHCIVKIIIMIVAKSCSIKGYETIRQHMRNYCTLCTWAQGNKDIDTFCSSGSQCKYAPYTLVAMSITYLVNLSWTWLTEEYLIKDT